MKKLLLVLGILLLLAFAFIVYIAWPWILLFTGIQLGPTPPKPEITYGEFPFRLEYEINGERKVIQDTLICEFDGFDANEAYGKFRKWKERLASGKQNVLLLNTDGAPGLVFGNKTVEQVIYYDPGPAWYYMGDNERGGGYEHTYPNASFSEQYQDGSGAKGIIQADELLKNYNIKLISWVSTPPIVNNFPKTK